MRSETRLGAVYYLLSVFCFALASHLTARLVPNLSATVVMGLRTFVSSLCLWPLVVGERRFDSGIVLNKHVWVWAGMFTVTVFCYGMAFTAPLIDDVLLISAT